MCHYVDIEFDNKSGNYWPVLYLNDYWNLARDYQPVNDTTKSVGVVTVYIDTYLT